MPFAAVTALLKLERVTNYRDFFHTVLEGGKSSTLGLESTRPFLICHFMVGGGRAGVHMLNNKGMGGDITYQLPGLISCEDSQSVPRALPW